MKKLLKLMGLLLLTIFLGACQAQNAATPSNQTAATSSSVTESSSTSTTSTQIILIGDDMKTYQLDGNQLTLTEGDGDQDIYTKQ